MTKIARPFYLFFGLLNSSALLVAFYLSLSIIPIFFSYFTVLSNILITGFFIYLGIYNPKKISRTLNWFRGAAVLYMSMTGVIYWSILVNNHSLSIDPWINMTLHGVMPIAAFLSWILFPLNNKLVYRNALQWLSLPLLFVFITLIRGLYVNWYPYFFLNPVIEGGYLKVSLNILGILICSGLAGLALIWLGKMIHKNR